MNSEPISGMKQLMNLNIKNKIKKKKKLYEISLSLWKAYLKIRRPFKFLLNIYYPLILRKCGKNVDFETKMVLRNPNKISIGNNCSFSNYVVLDAHDFISIGDNCMFALKVSISTATHDYNNSPMNKVTITKPVMIGNNVWLGVGATVLPGVEIGDGAVIGAHSLVTKNISENSLVAGVPAAKIMTIDRKIGDN